MALRLIEILIPKKDKEEASKMLKENELVLDFWHDTTLDETITVKVVVRAEKSQNVIDPITSKFSSREEFKLLVQDLEAISPQPEEDKEKEEKSDEEKGETASISREELYSTLSDSSEPTISYVTLISLSAIVASLGILGDTVADIAVIIGAMVIAPIVGPNMGLSLSSTLAEPDLGKDSLKTILVGITAGFFVSALVGFFLLENPAENAFILTRLEPGLGDVVLALSAGIAGAIAYTRDVGTALIGVMVAISLVPTLAASGLLFGAGYLSMAGSSMLLFLINIICINLAGVLTFLLEGLKPRSWYQAKKAKNMTRKAMVIWISLLLVLILVIFLV